MASENHILRQLGWDTDFEQKYQLQNIAGSIPGRVVSDNRHMFQVLTEEGILQSQVSGRMRRRAEDDGNYPGVGDWVVLTLQASKEQGVIHSILPRKSRFSRQASGGRAKLSGGRTKEQVVAANIDNVFIVSALDEGRSTNARRLERYLTLVWASGASPVIVLNKSDLCADVDGWVRGVEPAAAGVPVHPVSALRKTGLDALRRYMAPGKTVALLGPSGVGKSALVNALLGEERQETAGIRERDRTGRHTTTARELILVPGGGAVIDTPGMREIQMWAGDDDLSQSFDDIQTLAQGCRFKDCAHGREPGCAVRAAIESGGLDAGRLDSFAKLRIELVYHEARQDGNERRLERERWKKISQAQKTRRDR